MFGWFRAPPAVAVAAPQPRYGDVEDFDVLVDESAFLPAANSDSVDDPDAESPEEFDEDLPTKRLGPKQKPDIEALAVEAVDADELVISEQILCPNPAEQAMVDELVPKVMAYAVLHQPAPTSFPTLAARALSRRSLELEELQKTAAQDVAIGAAVLRAANSPLFYRGSQVEETRNAVSLLGQVATGQIVTGVASRALFDMQTRAEYELFPKAFNRLFHHAMTTAMTASWLADLKRLPVAERAFSGGLFCDIGKLVGLRALSAMVLSGKIEHPLPELVVSQILEGVHVEIGTDFHARWTLPKELSEICAKHHDDEVPLGPQYSALHLVRVASGLDELRVDPVMNAGVAPQTRQSVRALGLSKPEIVALGAKLGDIASYVSTTFG